MSRPEKPIDWDVVDELLMADVPGTHIASYYAMHPNTFYDRVVKKFGVSFTEYSTQKQATGAALLRLAQYKKALGMSKKGDNTLLIFLGKARLGQRENQFEAQVSEETAKQYEAIMQQLGMLQSERKMADNINKSE